MAAPAARPLMEDIEPTNSKGPSSLQDPEPKIPTAPDSKRAKKFPKWRRTLVFWLTSSAIVFAAQLSFTLWAYLRAPNDDFTSYYNRNLYEGRCSVAKSINTGVHLLLNVLSTLLLSGGYYCMQCLLSPTRSDINEAHSKYVWLDIGFASVRNLRRLNKWRIALWTLLGLSSLSLHLFYNSMIFSSVPNESYDVFVVNDAFGLLNSPTGGPTDFTVYAVESIQWNTFGNWSWDMTFNDDFNGLVDGAFNTLTPAQCLAAYATDFQSSSSTLFLVSKDNLPGNNASLPAVMDAYTRGNTLPAVDPFAWVCNQFPNSGGKSVCADHVSSLKANVTSWTPFNHSIDYCLTRYVGVSVLLDMLENCRVQADMLVALIVGIVSLVQLIILCIVVFAVRKQPLLTQGDAVLSFLEDPDSTTAFMCLLDKADVQRFKDLKGTSHPDMEVPKWISSPKRYSAKRKHRFTVVSPARWSFFVLLLIALLITTTYFLTYGLHHLPSPLSFSSLWNLGFGIHSATIIAFPNWTEVNYGDYGLFNTVMLANMTQPILSLLYLFISNILTSMVQASELNSYSAQQKGLRISTLPVGAQRNAYFLSLPYRYSIPLIVCGAFLHFLVSQSLFVVVLTFNALWLGDGSGDVGETVGSNFTCGYSPMAAVLAIALAGLIALAVIGLSFRRFRTGMPVMGGCSVAIAAACHPPVGGGTGEVVETDKELMWGVTGVGPGGVRHCGFSSGKVGEPMDGSLYA